MPENFLMNNYLFKRFIKNLTKIVLNSEGTSGMRIKILANFAEN